MKIYPLGRNLLILPIKEEELKTASGIILPNAALKQDPKGFVNDKGSGDKWNDMSEFTRMDVVQYARGSGVPVIIETFEGELVEYLLVPYDKIHGVL